MNPSLLSIRLNAKIGRGVLSRAQVRRASSLTLSSSMKTGGRTGLLSSCFPALCKRSEDEDETLVADRAGFFARDNLISYLGSNYLR